MCLANRGTSRSWPISFVIKLFFVIRKLYIILGLGELSQQYSRVLGQIIPNKKASVMCCKIISLLTLGSSNKDPPEGYFLEIESTKQHCRETISVHEFEGRH